MTTMTDSTSLDTLADAVAGLSTEAQVPTAPAVPESRQVIYCGVCSLPPEYCEFGGTVKRCMEWLEKTHGTLYEQLYRASNQQNDPTSTDSSNNPTSSSSAAPLSASAQARAEKLSSQKTAKAEAQLQAETNRRLTSKVQIKRVERNKRKFVTAVSGLEVFGLDLKKVAREMGRRFATGSSVTKVVGMGSGSAAGTAGTTAGGGAQAEEIVLQGDVSDEVKEWLLDSYGVSNGGAIPDGNVELVDDKKGRKAR